jgi:hypothetical protein
MCRSYGTQLTYLISYPWIEIHGYNIDRAYGTSASTKTVGNGQRFNCAKLFLIYE